MIIMMMILLSKDDGTGNESDKKFTQQHGN